MRGAVNAVKKVTQTLGEATGKARGTLQIAAPAAFAQMLSPRLLWACWFRALQERQNATDLFFNGLLSSRGVRGYQRERMHFHIVTLFPDFFASPLSTTMLEKGRERGALEFSVHDVRDFTTDKHRVADDTPYGGGQGMVMKPDPLVAAIEATGDGAQRPRRILLSPRGKVFDAELAVALASEDALALICGRYEGVDERVLSFIDDEISIGDYVISGGEPAALVVIDAVARLVPGVLGCAQSAVEESFADGLLEFPQYTRPPEFRGMAVPEVLLSGDHAKIAAWRRRESLRRTAKWRPDLLRHADLSAADRAWLEQLNIAPEDEST